LFIIVMLLGLAATIAGFICVIYPIAKWKIRTRKQALIVLAVGFVAFIGGGIAQNIQQENEAKELGYESYEAMRDAERLEEEKAKQIEAEKKAAEAARLAEAKAEEQARLAAEEAEDKRKGFHCLSAWDGAYNELERYVEKRLRDPDSYEHIETRIAPVSESGTHLVYMQYRARNGFGGMTIGEAMAEITNEGCIMVSAVVE